MKRILFQTDVNIFQSKKHQSPQHIIQDKLNNNDDTGFSNKNNSNSSTTLVNDLLPELNVKKLNCPTTLDTPVKPKQFKELAPRKASLCKSSSEATLLVSSLGFHVSPKVRITSSSSLLASSSPFFSPQQTFSSPDTDSIPLIPCHAIFEIPEIVSNIVFFLHLNSPHLRETVSVNKTFHHISSQILNKDLKITNSGQLQKFNNHYEFKTPSSRKSPERLTIVCDDSSNLQTLNVNFHNLKYLEIKNCKKMISLPRSLVNSFILNSTTLHTLKLPGCINFSNTGLKEILGALQKAQEIDLRQCYRLTDNSIMWLVSQCSQLTSLNLNRKPPLSCTLDNYYSKYALSDRVLHAIIDNNLPLHTLGIAGSNISDHALWELCTGRATHFNYKDKMHKVRYTLKRLSCNDCRELTELSLPCILKNNGFPNLQVLEIKNNTKLENHMTDIFKFKISKELNGIPILVSCCDYLQQKMNELQDSYNVNVIEKVLQDMTLWCNSHDS
ncbi:hypothetical protein ACO0RG_002736 [Hanseniaspora osmophila]|uniref:Antagonist of mitotic exit network protein 1 n=1 Tax=Hanseniaspora osmophila TaxID=56408 RepID=A0A1E5R7L5_9ASCO|nr:Antagonist of mitotic exit network protein 1 [Hanseniaspora osmophila]